MTRVSRALAQTVVYGGFAALVGYFSSAPAYQYLAPDRALVKLSFSHAGAPIRPCRERTAEELAELAPNMRRARDCPRQRVDLVVVLELDGRVVLRERLPPSGLAGDGEASIYRSLPVPAGRHSLTARLRDTPRPEGFDHVASIRQALQPGQTLVVDFDSGAGDFVFR